VKLEIRDLEVRFGGPGTRPAASVAQLAVDGGEIVGLAGESGSGKSMTILAVLGLAGTAGATVTGSVRLDGRELIGLADRQLRAIRGSRPSSRVPRWPSTRYSGSAASCPGR
jgi:ABC-type glutathione transport system ATPase component